MAFHMSIPVRPEIQSTSLDLNVRGWTPGVEPCAETKSSRHCHLGRDARVFTPAGEFPLYVHFPPPVFRQSSFLACPRREATSNIHPSRATLRTLRPAYPRTTRRFSYQFIFPFIIRLQKNRRAQAERILQPESAFMRSFIVVLSAGRDQEKKDKAGVEKAREDEEKKYR